jgi:hypothetical protein
LVAAGLREGLLVAELVEEGVAADGLLLGDADVLLLQGHRPVRVVEIKEAAVRPHAQQRRDVFKIGQRRRDADEARHLHRGLDLAEDARDDGLEHRAALVVQQVDLVDDHEPHELRVRALARLSRHDVPLLRRRHQQLRLRDLGLAQLRVAGELGDGDAVRRQPRAKVAHHLLHQRLHRRNVHDLEFVQSERHLLRPRAARVGLGGLVIDDAAVGGAGEVEAELVQDREHRHVGLARARRRADEHVVRLEHCERVHARLHAVQLLHAAEGGARPGRELGEADELLVGARRRRA